MKIGFIGVGTMGRPMAGHLLNAGHEVRLVGNKTPLPTPLLTAGAIACASPGEAADASEILILMLPDTGSVEQVLFGANGAATHLRDSKVVIDMSSIDPFATKEFAAKISAGGGSYIDAPVSGGELGAKNASLTIMVGGEKETFLRVEPLLKLMGKTITLVGGAGAGQIAKIANQIIVALNIEAVAEALVFAAKAGADPSKVREAISGGFASSRILEVHGERMIKRTFQPGFRIELHQKDLAIALAAAKALGVSLPNTAGAQQLFSACASHGHAALDHSAMVKALEMLADHDLA